MVVWDKQGWRNIKWSKNLTLVGALYSFDLEKQLLFTFRWPSDAVIIRDDERKIYKLDRTRQKIGDNPILKPGDIIHVHEHWFIW